MTATSLTECDPNEWLAYVKIRYSLGQCPRDIHAELVKAYGTLLLQNEQSIPGLNASRRDENLWKIIRDLALLSRPLTRELPRSVLADSNEIYIKWQMNTHRQYIITVCADGP